MRQHSQYPLGRGLGLALSAQVWLRSFRIAMVVGTLLNLINQGKAIRHGFAGLDIPRFFLNFLVPYLVATYSAVKTTLADEGKGNDSVPKMSQGPGQNGP